MGFQIAPLVRGAPWHIDLRPHIPDLLEPSGPIHDDQDRGWQAALGSAQPNLQMKPIEKQYAVALCRQVTRLSVGKHRLEATHHPRDSAL